MTEELLKGEILTEERRQARIQEEIKRLDRVKKELQGDKEYQGSIGELEKTTLRRWFGYYQRASKIIIDGETDVHKAYRTIVIDGMGVDQRLSDVVEETNDRIVFRSRNFCPILEACKELNLDTNDVCKRIYEPPVQKIITLIHPKMKFTRDYISGLRPCREYCEETFFILP